MKYFKRYSLIFFAIVILFAFFPVQAFADVVEFQEAAKLGASIVDIYGAVNNTSLAFDTLSDGSALTVIESLYSQYSSSASDPYTLAAIGAAAAAAGAVAVVYDAITGKGYIQLYQTQYIESLDGFWDYTLSNAGLLRNHDGLFEWQFDSNDAVIPVTVDTYSPSASQLVSVFSTNPTSSDLRTNGTDFALWNWSTWQYGNTYFMVSVPSYGFIYRDGSNYYASIVNFSSTFRHYYLDWSSSTNSSKSSGNGNSSTFSTSYNGNNYSGNRFYYKINGFISSPLPVFDSFAAGVADIKAKINLGSTAVVCQPEYYVGDPLTAVPTIDIPNVSDPNYLPQPIRINTGIEWDPNWGNPVPGGGTPEPGVVYPVTDPAILNSAVPDIWSDVVQGVDPDVEPEPEPEPEPGNPSEVFIPLLPVTVPSFDFNFVGIWHYVREWVASLGAFLTLLLSVWASLPWAIVVPVYASLVILIVLGVYRRFFM